MKTDWRKFISRKLIISLLGLIFAILAANGVIVPEATQDAVANAIIAIVASYNIGQGIADGMKSQK